jgi:hypothetical protein
MLYYLHVTVGAGNYLLEISNMLELEGTGADDSCYKFPPTSSTRLLPYIAFHKENPLY